MKWHLKLATVGTMAAGMMFAQTQNQYTTQGDSEDEMASQATTSGDSQAQTTTPRPMNPNWRERREAMRDRMVQELNLSETQKAKAKTIWGDAREAAKPLRTKLQANRDEMRTAMKANDTAKIRELSQERGRLMGQLVAIRTEANAKFYKELTPAQRQKADQIHERMKERMQQHRTETESE